LKYINPNLVNFDEGEEDSSTEVSKLLEDLYPNEIGYITSSNVYAINAINRTSGNVGYDKPFFIDAQKLILNNGSSGNVGIGTTNPTYTLDINAPNNVRFFGNSYTSLTIATTSGTNFSLTNRYTDNRFSIDATGFGEIINFMSNGIVGIGTNSPTSGAKVHIVGQGSDYGVQIDAALTNTGGSDNLFIRNTSSGNYVSIGLSANGSDGQHHRAVLKAIKDPINSGNAAGIFQLDVRNTGASYTTALTANALGNVGIGTTNPATKLHVNGGLRLQGGATNLSYYEEGSWTPSLANATVTYQFNSGTYVRIGNYVFVRWGFRISTISGQSGTVQINGLPFTAVNWGGYQEPNISVSTGNLGTADYAQRARVFVGGSNTSLFGRIANNGDTTWNTSELNNGSWILGEIFYNVP
jgi:hypothetical protein